MEYHDSSTVGYGEPENWTGAINTTANYNGTDEISVNTHQLIWTIVFNTLYAIICLVGIVGNALVIFVVARYTKMKTVTNMYIMNLALADLCFLVFLPLLIVTTSQQKWLFGYAMCKVFFIVTSINWFTSVFTLTVMSADRYLAVCHPVQSMNYRTPTYSSAICIGVWIASFLVMLPIVLYATTVPHKYEKKSVSCTLKWPEGQAISPEKAFIWYAMLLGFAIPVGLIIVFYALVLNRLKTLGPKNKSKEKKRSHRKVSKMVLTVIAVYVVCWLPHWAFQVALTFGFETPWGRPIFQFCTCLSYANSMFNPVLYAFLSENFRKSFLKAFQCAAPHEVNGALAEQSTCHGTKTRSTSVGNTRHQMTRVPSEDGEVKSTQEATTMTVLTSQMNNDGYVVIPSKTDTPT